MHSLFLIDNKIIPENMRSNNSAIHKWDKSTPEIPSHHAAFLGWPSMPYNDIVKNPLAMECTTMMGVLYSQTFDESFHNHIHTHK